MQNGRRVNRLQMSRFTARGLRFYSQLGTAEQRYRHILVSTTLNPDDRASLLLGFELASFHQAAITLLHVLPRPRNDLDAIGLLHNAADEFRQPLTACTPADAARSNLHAFVNDVIPRYLLNSVSWDEECRSGNLAGSVVAQVNECGADLVILAAKPFRWWLPRVPLDLWTIRRRVRARVIVIRHQAKSFLS